MANYNPEQTAFLFARMAELGSLFSGTSDQIEAAALKAINQELSDAQAEIGSWSVVWRPAVQTLPLCGKVNQKIVNPNDSDCDNYIQQVA